MGSKKNKKQRKQTQVLPDYNWPFEISIKLNRNRPKIAFLSGISREYYPEDPGFSKFALTYGLPIPDYDAKCNFVASTNLIQKPVSKIGYGIGGLLGPRFARLDNEENPAPNEYQSELIPAPVKKSERRKRIKWKDFVELHEKIVEEQYAKAEAARLHKLEEGMEGAWRRKTMATATPRKTAVLQPKNDNFYHRALVHLGKIKQRDKLCQKKFSAFGMGFNNTRFPSLKINEKVGVGTYEVGTPTMKQSFQITTPEGKLVPRVRTVCHPLGCDYCMTCDLPLMEEDYYQTRNKFKIENAIEHQQADGKYKLSYMSLCRDCYCHAIKYGCPPWSKQKIPTLFMKARHCKMVHDHREGHAEYLMKSSCKGMLNLARRELMYSRHFKDDPCERII